MMFDKEEKKLLLELISNEQIHMLMKDSKKYLSEKYVRLEGLKAKINDENPSDCTRKCLYKSLANYNESDYKKS